MLADFRAAGVAPDVEADVCIVGGGAAGITLARELAGTRARVCVLESGGLASEAETQALYRGRETGFPSFPLETARLRYLGGSTNHWLAWCMELAPNDLRPRPWIPQSGWPIAYGELARFYPRARALLGLDRRSDRAIARRLGVAPLPVDRRRIVTRLWQIGDPPLRFGEAFRRELEEAPNVRVLLHANATELILDPGGTRLAEVTVRSLDGKAGRVRAAVTILACGGVENARLLLASRGVLRAGVGNRHDLVGRFFMDHFQPHFGDLLTGEAKRVQEAWGWHRDERRHYLTALAMSDAVQAAEGVANTATYLTATAPADAARDSAVVDELGESMGRVLHDLDGRLRRAWGRWTGLHAPTIFHLIAFGEQVPNPASRVTLVDERDALGMPRVQLDWRLTELDRRGIAALGRALGAELGRLGLGRVRLAPWVLDADADWSVHAVAGYHHSGTTRMATDPRHGVVDADCRVHELDNLYVAGSSVFPTAGFANPTLTIVALAMRLAAHVRERLERARPVEIR